MRRLFALLLLVITVSPAWAEEEQQAPLRFTHESTDRPELAELRRLYDFDEVASGAGSEFERMLLLKDWVFRNVDFRHNYRFGNLRNTLGILAMAAEGTGFHCSQFAAVYTQLAVAMGWTPRYLFMRNTRAEEHASNEIWSNEWAKWVFIDVTWNLHIEKDGVPLSTLEIRKEWLTNGGTDLVYVFGAGEQSERYTSDDFPVQRSDNNAWIWWPIDEVFISYTYQMALVTRNDFFSHGDGSGEAIWDDIVILKDEVNGSDRRWSFRNRPNVTDMRALYHDVNRVDILACDLDARTLALKLDAFGPFNDTPNFQEYLVRIGDGPWRVSEPLVVLRGRERSRTVQARVRNKAGVLGPVATYTWNP